MSQFKFKTTLVRGLALGIPIAVILYVFIRILVVIEKLISPAAEAIGIQRLLGEITLNAPCPWRYYAVRSLARIANPDSKGGNRQDRNGSSCAEIYSLALPAKSDGGRQA